MRTPGSSRRELGGSAVRRKRAKVRTARHLRLLRGELAAEGGRVVLKHP